EPPAGGQGPDADVALAVLGKHLRRRRLWPRLRGGVRSAEDAHPLLEGRVLLGRRGLDRLLGRSGGAGHGGVHDPADAVHHLSYSAGASDLGLFGADGEPGGPWGARRLSSRCSSSVMASLSSIIGGPRPVSGASALGVMLSIRALRQPPQR